MFAFIIFWISFLIASTAVASDSRNISTTLDAQNIVSFPVIEGSEESFHFYDPAESQISPSTFYTYPPPSTTDEDISFILDVTFEDALSILLQLYEGIKSITSMEEVWNSIDRAIILSEHALFHVVNNDTMTEYLDAMIYDAVRKDDLVKVSFLINSKKVSPLSLFGAFLLAITKDDSFLAESILEQFSNLLITAESKDKITGPLALAIGVCGMTSALYNPRGVVFQFLHQNLAAEHTYLIHQIAIHFDPQLPQFSNISRSLPTHIIDQINVEELIDVALTESLATLEFDNTSRLVPRASCQALNAAIINFGRELEEFGEEDLLQEMRGELVHKLDQRCSFWSRLLQALDTELDDVINDQNKFGDDRTAIEALQDELCDSCFTDLNSPNPETIADESRLLDMVAAAYTSKDQSLAQKLILSFITKSEDITVGHSLSSKTNFSLFILAVRADDMTSCELLLPSTASSNSLHENRLLFPTYAINYSLILLAFSHSNPYMRDFLGWRTTDTRIHFIEAVLWGDVDKATALITTNQLTLKPLNSSTEEIDESNWRIVIWALAWCKVKDDLKMFNDLVDAIKQLHLSLKSSHKKRKSVNESPNWNVSKRIHLKE